MKKTICLFIILNLMLIILTGCYDAKSIENFSYVIGIAIDKSDSENIKLSMQMANSSSGNESKSSQSTKSNIITVDCNDIASGISIINNYSTKKINLAHCTVIVFSEEIAKEGIEKYVDTIVDNLEIRPTCNLIISSSKALDFLSSACKSGEEFSSRYYEYILNSSDYTGFTTKTTLSAFFSKLKMKPHSPIAIYSSINEDIAQNTGLAIFKNDKYINNISPLETIFYMMLKNELKSAIIDVPNPYNSNEKDPLLISLSKNTKTDINLENNIPFIKINIYIDGQIQYSSLKESDYLDFDKMNDLEASVNRYLEANIEKFLYKLSKEFNSDICEYSQTLMKKYTTSDEWEKVNWDDVYKNSIFEVTVSSTISSNYLFNHD